MVRTIMFQSLVQREEDHRLDVQGVAAAVLGAVAAVEVVLERHADEVRDGVGRASWRARRRCPEGVGHEGA